MPFACTLCGVMEPIAFFVLQFLWFLFAWSLIARFVLFPWSAALPPDARLSVWVAPEMFRVLGVGLLVPNLSPGMPLEFAVPTAVAFPHAASIGAIPHLAAQWYVPVFAGPPLVIGHVVCWILLLRREKPWQI